MINCHFLYRMSSANFSGYSKLTLIMRKRLDLHRSFYVGLFLILTGLISSQVNADGIASVNSYVEIKSSATDFRARKESTNGQRSTSGFDFIISPERTDICQQGQSSSICTNTYNFSGLGYVPTGSATSIVFRDTPANSYLVFINDDHNNGTDRTSLIGQIVFDYEILGYWTDPSMTVDFDYVEINWVQLILHLALMVTAQGRQKIMFIMAATRQAQLLLVIGYLLVLIKEL